MPSRAWLRQNRYWVLQSGLAVALIAAIALVSVRWVPAAGAQLLRLFGNVEDDLRAVRTELDLEQRRRAELEAAIDSLSARLTNAAAETTVLKQIRESSGECGISITSYDQLRLSTGTPLSTTSFRIRVEGKYDQIASMFSQLYRSNPRLMVESLDLERVAAPTAKLRCVFVVRADKKENGR